MQIICTLLQTDNYIDTSSIFTGRMLFLTPNQQCQSAEGNYYPVFSRYFSFCCPIQKVVSLYFCHGGCPEKYGMVGHFSPNWVNILPDSNSKSNQHKGLRGFTESIVTPIHWLDANVSSTMPVLYWLNQCWYLIYLQLFTTHRQETYLVQFWKHLRLLCHKKDRRKPKKYFSTNCTVSQKNKKL